MIPFRVGGVAAGSVALEGHAEGEQLLDDMVVQVTRDAVMILGLSQNDLVDAGPGEFHGRGGLACEGRSHVHVCLGEPRICRQPTQHQRAADLLAGG